MQRKIDTVEPFWEVSQLEEFAKKATKSSKNKFISNLKEFLRAKNSNMILSTSGSKALEILLKNKVDFRKNVLAPAFNCQTVKTAIAQSGCNLITYNFTQQAGYFDWDEVERLIDENVGVIIVTHFFGLPTDFRNILQICKKRKIVIIEDCAHTLGGKIGDKMAGTIGDASIFSFNYDKPLSLCWGGALLVNNHEAFRLNKNTNNNLPEIEEEYKRLKEFKNWQDNKKKWIKYEYNFIFRIYKRLISLLRVKGRNASLKTFGAIQAEIGIWSLSRLVDVIQKRNANAEKVLESFKGPSWYIYPNTTPAYLRAKIGFSSSAITENIIRIFRRNSIRAGVLNWPYTINDECENINKTTSNVCNNWIDIPIHQNLTQDDIKKINSILNDSV